MGKIVFTEEMCRDISVGAECFEIIIQRIERILRSELCDILDCANLWNHIQFSYAKYKLWINVSVRLYHSFEPFRRKKHLPLRVATLFGHQQLILLSSESIPVGHL